MKANKLALIEQLDSMQASTMFDFILYCQSAKLVPSVLAVRMFYTNRGNK